MKKAILLLLTIISITSCEDLFLTHSEYQDKEFTKRARNHELYDTSDYDFDSLAEIGGWISQNIKYKSDEGADDWANPEDTINRGYGDCEDRTILFMNMAYFAFGIEPTLAGVYHSRHVAAGGDVNHAVVMIDGELYEPAWFWHVDYEVKYYYTFWEVFKGE